MFIPYTSDSIRYTGRFAKYFDSMTATAPGSYFEMAYSGELCILHFNVDHNLAPMPHLWIQVDGGAKIEAPLSRFIRIQTGAGSHTAKIIFKGAREIHHRWYTPLVGKISLKGFEADAPGILPFDNRKTIEFVGDSITEGVLIDQPYRYDEANDQNNRIFQDDSTATYAALTADYLNLRPLTMGYGAVGTTHGGCGAVPKAADAYPFCFNGAPVTYGHPDYILINHGANDRGGPEEEYIRGYRSLLDVIRKQHPESKIICLSAFCGVYPEALEKLIENYNTENGDDIFFIDATLWVPSAPLHPLRDGHKIIANRLSAILKEKYGL